MKQRKKDMIPGYNEETIDFFELIIPPEPVDKKDVNALRDRWNYYKAMCREYDKKVMNMAAQTAMGLNRDDLRRWAINPNDPRNALAQEVLNYCAMYRESMIADGQVNNVLGIFWQKNYDGFKDTSENVNVNINPLAGLDQRKAIEQRYMPVDVIQEPKNPKLEFVKSESKKSESDDVLDAEEVQ